MAPIEILTVGHSNHSEEEFIELLRGAGVQLIADVRANPRSRYPHFNRAKLTDSLRAAEIRYVHLGEQLGGRREPLPGSPNGALGQSPFRGYADHMQSEVFEDGLRLLTERATERRTAVMCAEADWRHCHRGLMADVLLARGWTVLHLGAEGSLAPHALNAPAAVEDGRVTYPLPQTSLDV